MLQSLLESLGIGGSSRLPNDGAPSRLAMLSGGVITVSIVLLLLAF